MRTKLVPCPGCDRHVRQSERACPFCAAPIAASVSSEGPAPKIAAAGLTRAAILFAGATAVAACAPANPPDDGAVADTGNDTATNPDIVALYGPAPVDVQPDDAASDVQQQGDVVAMYGPAPVDVQQQNDASDDGEIVALYGPAPVDGG